jgi:DNA-binding MurR/RpiR family transcriptional regulator
MVATAVGMKAEVSQDLKEKILGFYPRLPANQRRVADYILRSGSGMALLTSGDLARHLGVSKATIVRFSQRLGYAGFVALKGELAESLRSGMQAVDRFILTLEQHASEETLSLVAKHELQNINQTIAHLDRQAFHRAVKRILKADRVLTMGIGISSLMAQVLAYELSQVAVDARALSSASVRFVEGIALAAERDVVIGFSFPPYSRETVEAAEYARQRGIPVVAITDRETSPIALHAADVLAVRSENMLYTNSLSAILVVVNALVTELAAKNRQRVAKAFKESTQILQRTDQFVP